MLIIIFCQIKQGKTKHMFYFPHCLLTEFRNSAFYPNNFFIPAPYPYIINGSFSQNFASSDQSEVILKKQQPLEESYLITPPYKIFETGLSPNKIQKREKETSKSLPQKQQARMSRELATFVDEEGKIHVRIEWRNQNRNIIPNIMNQLMSYLTKPFKSKKIVSYIFDKHRHQPSWTPKRYYNYLKIIKDKTSHYLDQSDLKTFFVIQSPHCEIYSFEEQEFYMKICRILAAYYLKNEVVLIATTSTRMNEYNRKIHLIGREVLLKIFYQIVGQFKTQ